MRDCLLLICVFGLATPVLGDVLRVPTDFETIQGCIDAAVDGDECVVSPGRYNEVIDLIGKAITVRSVDPTDAAIVEATVIDGAGLNNSVVKCVSGEDADTVLSGLTITGGTGSQCTPGFRSRCGGGMRNRRSSPSVSHCVFRNNAADGGGGMLNSGASPTITDCTFSSNRAVYGGGGLYNSCCGSATVRDCLFVGNVAAYPAGRGGGMFNSYTAQTIVSTVFDGNLAVYGGAMYNNEVEALSLVDCVFTSNFASVRGGGIFNQITKSSIVDCRFLANKAREEGGGIFNFRSYREVVTRCTFHGNVAVSGGGAFNKSSGSQRFLNCIFSGNAVARVGGGLVFLRCSGSAVTNSMFVGNSAEVGGGMLTARSNTPVVSNCTFTQNVARDGGAVASVSSRLGTHSVEAVNSIFDSVGGGIWSDDESAITVRRSNVRGEIQGEVIDGGGNIDADPMFARVSDDGGDGWGDDPETLDVDESLNDDFGDLRVRAGSPVIDAGDNEAVPVSVVTDLGGLARFVDDPFTVDTGIGDGAIVDMGAYEYQPDCNGNGVADDVDVAEGMSFDCNENGYPDECDGDSDSDGVPDECDACGGSDVGETIRIGRCETGIANDSLGEGCMMADAVGACLKGSRPGRAVSCVTELARDWKQEGIIGRRGYLALISCAISWNDRIIRAELGDGMVKRAARRK